MATLKLAHRLIVSARKISSGLLSVLAMDANRLMYVASSAAISCAERQASNAPLPETGSARATAWLPAWLPHWIAHRKLALTCANRLAICALLQLMQAVW